MYSIQTSPERKLKLCALPSCKGKRYDLVHKFPMNNERAQQWIDAIDLPELKNMPLDLVRKRFFICTKHFRPQDYKNCESRSLNTTAYPRLLLKTNDNHDYDDQSTEHCVEHVQSNTASDPLDLDYEYDSSAIVADLAETNFNKVPMVTFPAAKKTDIKSDQTSVQYIVCSPNSNVPILLRRTRNNQAEIVVQKPIRTQTTQKSIPIKSVVRDSDDTTTINRNTNTTESKHQTGKIAVKRNTNYTLEPARKKLHLNESEINQNEMPGEKGGMITLQHKSLKSPFKVASVWLRDHCRCSMCYGETFQRKFNITDIPLDVEPTKLKTEDNNVQITWSDNHESSYDILDLYNQLSAKPGIIHLKQFLWSTADIVSSDYANVTLNDYLCNDEVAKDVVASLIKFGCAFIKNVPANLQSTEIAVRRLFPIQKTIFGEMWSFSDNKAHNDTAYTNVALPAHNDNTYFNDAAGLQILHCISRCAEGGDNLLVDGFNVVKKLRETNPDAYEYLSQVNVPSEYIEDGYHFKHCAPVIIKDPVTGEPNQIRFNMNDRAFFNSLPQDQMLQFYRHYMALAKEIQSDENEWRFKLEPGTVCIFDNWRLLHGRTEYSGRRQMVGCYVARSEFLSVARRHALIS